MPVAGVRRVNGRKNIDKVNELLAELAKYLKQLKKNTKVIQLRDGR